MFFVKKRGMERVAWCLVNDASADRVVAEFMREMVFYYEWEGMSEAPLGEARAAGVFEAASVEPACRLRASTLGPPLLVRGRIAGRGGDDDHEFEEPVLRGVEGRGQLSNPLIRSVAEGINRSPGCQF